jgi:hypothetical protein
MANEVSNKTPAGLPADYGAQLLKGVASSPLQSSGGGGGVPLLRMERGNGAWVHGAASEKVEAGAMLAVNPLSFAHGWVNWIQGTNGGKSRKVGEVMGPMTQDAPPCPDPVEGHPYSPQAAFGLKFLNGKDEGLEVVFRSPSMGGTEAALALVQTFQRHYATDEGKHFPCPVIELRNTNYRHASYGLIYKPVFEVVGWADMNGNMPEDFDEIEAPAAPEPEPEPVAAPRRRTRPAAATPDPGPAPVSTTQARRRPVR